MLRRSLLLLVASAAVANATLAHANWFSGPTIRGSGVVKNETREVGTFTGVALAISALVEVGIGAKDSRSLQASISGSGDLTVGGRVDSLQASIAGSGNLKSGTLETRRASVKIAGSGYARLWARETLAVSIAGSGDVNYYGDPAVTQATAGSGSLKRLGAAPG